MSPLLNLDQTDFKAVAAQLNERITALGLTQQQVAERAGLSRQVIRDLQHGRVRSYHPNTLTKVARAVGWPSAAIARVLVGMAPAAGQTDRLPPPA